jgi:hypothetical protein
MARVLTEVHHKVICDPHIQLRTVVDLRSGALVTPECVRDQFAVLKVTIGKWIRGSIVSIKWHHRTPHLITVNERDYRMPN